MNEAADVVADDLAENFVDHRHWPASFLLAALKAIEADNLRLENI
jgi:hypothetical protein